MWQAIGARACCAVLLLAASPAVAQDNGGLPPGMMMGGGGGGGMGGGSDAPETHNAEELTTATYEERLESSELLLVLFRRPGNSGQQAEKEFELAATELAHEDAALALGLVDITSDEAKGAVKKAKADPEAKNPELKLFRQGKPLNLGGLQLDARNIVNTMRYLAAPVAYRMGSNSTKLNEWVRHAGSSVVLGIFADDTRPSHQTWAKVAEGLRPPWRFGEVSLEGARGSKLFAGAELEEGKNQYAVVLPPRWVGKGEAAYHLGSDFRQMASFIPAHASCRVGPLTSQAHAATKKEGRILVSIYLDTQALEKMWKYILNRVHKLLDAEPELTSRFTFTITDRRKQEAGLTEDFGVNGTRDFVVVAVNLTSHEFFGTEVLADQTADAFSALPLAPFLRSVVEGTAPAYVKSEEPPAEPAPRGQVGTAVASTFNTTVDDEAVDVLLGLYVAGVKATQTLPAVAAMLRPLPNLRVYAMNASSNKFSFERFPLYSREQYAYFMLPAGGKAKPVPYEGSEQNEAELGAFALKHATLSAGSPEPLVKVRKTLKAVKAAKAKEAAAMLGGMGGDLSGKKKTKKKKKKKRAAAKAEL